MDIYQGMEKGEVGIAGDAMHQVINHTVRSSTSFLRHVQRLSDVPILSFWDPQFTSEPLYVLQQFSLLLLIAAESFAVEVQVFSAETKQLCLKNLKLIYKDLWK